jgi:hypothetical protein
VSGYTPVFRSVFDGTLHGKWPQTGVWLALLAMVDRHGQIDRSPQAIASDIGIDVPTLLSCIAEFCEPDLMSRTRDHDGRRLELIDPERPWGWKVLNHGKYREKARLESKSAREVEDGKNKERMDYRKTAADRRSPPDTASDRPLKPNQTKQEKEGAEAPFVDGLDPKAWEAWTEYRKAIGKAIKPASVNAAAKAMAALGAGQASAVQHSIANSYTGLFAPTVNGKPQPQAKREHPPTPEEIAAARRKAASDNDAQVRKLGLSGALKGMP